MLQYYYIVDNGPSDPSYTRAHYHFCYELVYYFHGDGYSEYSSDNNAPALKKLLVYDTSIDRNKKKFDVHPGSFIIYTPYTIHNEVLTTPSEVFAITFRPPEDLPLQTMLCTDTDYSLGRMIEKIRTENRERLYRFNDNINAYLTEAIVHIKRQSAHSQSDPTSIRQAVYYIDDYYMTRLDIDKLATMAGYSPDHFRYLFKKETGVSPKQYILEKRFELARQQLEFTSLPIQKIAANCGYEDYMQFSAYFKKLTSQSPSEYRQTHLR